jgi:hypothetical protein
MTAPSRPHPAAPRMPLFLSVVLVFAAVMGVAFTLKTFVSGAEDPWLSRPLGGPATALLLLLCGLVGSRWFFAGGFSVDPHAVIAATIVVLSLAGILGAAQGVEPASQWWGGVAGRNLAYFFLSKLGWPLFVPVALFGASGLIGLALARRVFASREVNDQDASALFARLARARSGEIPASVEVAPPRPEEALGFPRPVALEPDLFGNAPELAEIPAFVSEEPTAEEEEPAPILFEPPPPPRRRRLLEDLVDETAFAEAAASVDETTTRARPTPTEPDVESTRVSKLALGDERVASMPLVAARTEFFGAGVIDAADDEDVLTPVAAAPAPIEASAPTTFADERESLDDAEEPTPSDAALAHEEERPLFVPPPRTIPYEDDEAGDVDDLPTDDESASATSIDIPVFTVEELELPPPPPGARFEPEAIGGRTGEAPERAIRDEDAPVETAAEAAAESEAQPTLFPDAAADGENAEEERAPKRRRARAPRPKRAPEPEVEVEGEAAAADAGAVADEVSLSTPLVEEAVIETPVAAEPAPAAPPARRSSFATPTPLAKPALTTAAKPSSGDDFETLVRRATEVVVGAQRCSPSLIQRELGVRFVEAAAVIERLHARGVVGPHTPSGVREVLLTARAAEA